MNSHNNVTCRLFVFTQISTITSTNKASVISKATPFRHSPKDKSEYLTFHLVNILY